MTSGIASSSCTRNFPSSYVMPCHAPLITTALIQTREGYWGWTEASRCILSYGFMVHLTSWASLALYLPPPLSTLYSCRTYRSLLHDAGCPEISFGKGVHHIDCLPKYAILDTSDVDLSGDTNSSVTSWLIAACGASHQFMKGHSFLPSLVQVRGDFWSS